MISRKMLKIGMAGLFAVLASGLAGAEKPIAPQGGTTPGSATDISIDTGWTQSNFNSTTGVRYYHAYLFSGRSYCLETRAPFYDIDNYTNDIYSYVYTSTAATTIFHYNDDWFQEPSSQFYTKNCFIWTPATNFTAISIGDLGGAPANTQPFDFRLVDTTLFGPWWYVDVASGYDTFIEVTNTTANTINIAVAISNPSGTVVGTASGILAGRANAGISVRAITGLVNGNGSVQIAHTGAPGAVAANATALSAVTGLSFDAPLSRRQNW